VPLPDDRHERGKLGIVGSPDRHIRAT